MPAGCIGISPIPVVIHTTDYYIQPAGSAEPADRSTTRPASGLYDWEQTATLSLRADSGIRRTSDAANTKDLTHSGLTENSDHEILYYRIANSGGYELPSTGGSGSSLVLRLIAALGAVLTVLAAALLTRAETE